MRKIKSICELSDDEEELSVVVVLSSSEVDVVVDELSLEVDELLSSLPHEIKVRLNKNMERIISICLIDFLIG